MGYTRRPFNPLTPTHNQVVNELNQANENFDILARAFLNNDPTTGVLKSDVYTFRRVDLTNATSDYMLQVGEEAIIYTNNRRIVPLHIATQHGAVYEMIISNSGQPAYLYPNNILYPNSFVSYRMFAYDKAVSESDWVLGVDGASYYDFGNSGYCPDPAFKLYAGLKKVLIINETDYKRLISHYSDVSNFHHGISTSFWRDNLTSWTSLGTLDLAFSANVFILVRRLM